MARITVAMFPSNKWIILSKFLKIKQKNEIHKFLIKYITLENECGIYNTNSWVCGAIKAARNTNHEKKCTKKEG